MKQDPAVVTVVRAPKATSDNDIRAFEGLVREGGEINPEGLSGRIMQAYFLAFAYEDGVLAGVGALKRPDATYRKSVFLKARATQRPTDFPFEMRWIYVRPAHRRKGISGAIVQCLMSEVRDQNVFATSRVNNVGMHKPLERAGFARVGKPYASQLQQCELALFISGTI